MICPCEQSVEIVSKFFRWSRPVTWLFSAKPHIDFVAIWGGSQTLLISPKSPFVKEYKYSSSSDFSPFFYIILEKSFFFFALIFSKKNFHFFYFFLPIWKFMWFQIGRNSFHNDLMYIASIITLLYSIKTSNQMAFKFTPKMRFSWFPYPPG
jgi:hypothetical protein